MSALHHVRTAPSRTVRLTIPGWAPSKSNSYRIGRRADGTPVIVKGGGSGRNHDKGNALAEFEQAALAAVLTNRVEPFEDFVSVEATVYPPNMRCDIPGCEKVLLDSLQNWRMGKGKSKRRRVVNIGGYGCYLNDSQVKRFLVEFGGVDKVNPRIVVTIKPWEAPR